MSSTYSTLTKNERVFAPIAQKTFENVLKNFYRHNFHNIGGDIVIDLLVKEQVKLIEKYYPPCTRVKMGQMLWFAVAEDDLPSRHKTMSETELRPIILTLICLDDIIAMKNGESRRKISENILARLYREAMEQGAVLSESDLSLLRNLSLTAIHNQTVAYEESNNTVLPRRGTVHDLGCSVTHKGVICKKRLFEKKSISDIAEETFHSTSAVSRYIKDLKRVELCLQKGLTIDEAAFASMLSKNVVNQYVDILQEFQDGTPF